MGAGSTSGKRLGAIGRIWEAMTRQSVTRVVLAGK
jgi:hypothetical protein